jgi:hypothetical protein
MEGTIPHRQVQLRIHQITQLAGIALGKPARPSKTKPAAIARLRSVLGQVAGDEGEEIHRRVILAGDCRRALELLKQSLTKVCERQGRTTHWFSHRTINGMGSELIPHIKLKEDEMSDETNTMEAEGNAADTPAPAPKAARKERVSEYANKWIVGTCKIDEASGLPINPRKQGSHGHRSMAVVLEAGADGLSYEDYIKGGGRPNDLKWDIDHGNVKLEAR